MSPEAQRIAIAEACPSIEHLRDLLANEETALYAMHEAEKVLNAEQQLTYTNRLEHAIKSNRHWMHAGFDLCHATAAQRAEAFLRALNLWQDTPEKVER